MHSYRDLLVFPLLGTRGKPRFGSADKTGMRWQRSLGILVDDLFKFWHRGGRFLEYWWKHAWLEVCILVQRSWEGDIRSLDLAVENDLCSDGSGKRPWISGLFRCGPGPIGFLAPRLMLVLIISYLVQLVKGLYVVG